MTTSSNNLADLRPDISSTVILGSGIAGLCTALAMASHGQQVTVLERDTAPPEGDADEAFFNWWRRGACQFRHPHAFLGLMCNLLQDHYPDLLKAFYAAGARRFEFHQMLPQELEHKYHAAPGDERLWMLLCRRATIETVLRQYVQALPEVEIINGITIDGVRLEQSDQGAVVQALTVRRDCVEQFGSEIPVTALIDASGRTTRFPRWFAAQGIQVEEEVDDAEIVYWTRHYKLNPGQVEPPRMVKDRASGDLGYIKYGVFPGDNGHFSIIVCLHVVEKELRKAIQDGDGFDRVCRSIPGLAPWVDSTRATATTHPSGIGDIKAVWRHYVADDKPLLQNFYAVGDAAVRTNPLYGRGCSTGILHGHILAEVLAGESDPVARGLLYNQRTEEQLRPIFKASLTEDRNGIRRSLAAASGELVDPPDSLKTWFGAAFGDALAAAARYNLRVLRGMMRTVNLLENPGDFLQDRRTRWIIMAFMLRGRRRNAQARIQRGPNRDEMLQLIQAQ